MTESRHYPKKSFMTSSLASDPQNRLRKSTPFPKDGPNSVDPTQSSNSTIQRSNRRSRSTSGSSRWRYPP
ncbi:hypothetical protein LINPERHAP1_LOCUS9741 [Linum perenne]